MRKPVLLTAAATLTVLATIVAIKSFVAVNAGAQMQRPVIAAARTATPPEMMAIVPAPTIDTKAEIFVGTGDGSGGGWVRP